MKAGNEKQSSYRRPRRSTSRLLKYPKHVVEEVDKMLLSVGPGRSTYKEISEWLKEEGYDMSESAVGRYAKYLFTQGQTKESVSRRTGSSSGRAGRFYKLINELLDLFERRQP